MSGSLIFFKKELAEIPPDIFHFVYIQIYYIKMNTLCPTKKEKKMKALRAGPLFYLFIPSAQNYTWHSRHLVNIFLCKYLYFTPFLKNIFIMYIILDW